MVESDGRIQDQKLERKRLKKLKRQQAALAEASQPSEPAELGPNANGSTSGGTADADSEAKPHKKKKKRKQQPDSTSSDPHTVPEEQKSKKKKRKQPQEAIASHAEAVQDGTKGLPIAKQSTDASAVPDQTATAAPAEAPKPKKKKSKATGASDAAMWAAVGNQEAARAGKPVQKALYTEDPAVTCMTDAAVQQWRDERQTAITGCDIKPVTAFSQAGERSGPIVLRQKNGLEQAYPFCRASLARAASVRD